MLSIAINLSVQSVSTTLPDSHVRHVYVPRLNLCQYMHLITRADHQTHLRHPTQPLSMYAGLYMSRPPDTPTCVTRLSPSPGMQLFTRTDHRTHIRRKVSRLNLCPCTQLCTRADHQTCMRHSTQPYTQLFTRADHQTRMRHSTQPYTQLFTRADHQTHVGRSVDSTCVHAHNSLHEQTAKRTYT